MKWIDMHCDTLSEIRKQKKSLSVNNLCTDIKRLRQGGACAQFFACFADAGEYGAKEKGEYGKTAWNSAYDEVQALITEAYRWEGMDFKIAHSKKDISADGNKICGILTVEEGGVLNGSIDRLEDIYKRGVRLMTLTWNYKNCIGSPNSTDRSVMEQGLTGFGFDVLDRMNELGMIIDVSHLSDGGFRDCIRRSRLPVVASHSNARSLCSRSRNLSDDMLRQLGENGGAAGVNFFSGFLTENGKADIDDIVRHIRYMENIAGEDAVALGSDFDGFAQKDCPSGMEGVSDMGKLFAALEKSGFTARKIEKLAGGNIRRVIREVWKS